MRAATAAATDLAEALFREFQHTFSARLDTMVRWEEAANSSTHLASGPAFKLALTRTPLGYRLSAIFMGSPLPGPGSGSATLIERGRRVLKHGSLLDLQELAIKLIRRGVRGGPAYRDEPPSWSLMPMDGSLRMAVPGGELRVTPIARDAGSAVDNPDSPCALTFEDHRRAYLIARDTGSRLKDTALEIWELQKTRRALQIRLNGKRVNLRTASVPGVLGYHAVAERTFIVLAWIEDDLGLYYLDGLRFAQLARLTPSDVRNGEPPDVDALLRACANGATESRSDEFVDPPANEPHVDVPAYVASARPAPDPPTPSAGAGRQRSPYKEMVARTSTRVDGGPAPERDPMPQWQLDLCQRHLRRLYTRLSGRGARKARELVRILHDALDRCREDISGSRRAVHELLEEMLEVSLTGGDRNIRDGLDLLAKESPLFVKDGHRCSILFARLHDPDSPLIRRIAEDEARAHAGTPASRDDAGADGDDGSAPPPPGPPGLSTAQVDGEAPPAAREAPSPISPTPSPPVSAARETTGSAPVTAPAPPSTPATTTVAPPAPEREHPWAPDLGAYRVLAAPKFASPDTALPASPTNLGISSLFSASSNAPIAGLLYDDPNDPYDPETESLNAPSRTLLASRQKPPGPGDGTQGSS